MKYKSLTAIALSAMAIMSCSVDTDTIGSTLTKETDKLDVSTGSFKAYSRSVLVDSVYARNYDTYFGRVKDPETGTYVKTEFMAQFNMQEKLNMPEISKILSTDADGRVKADSCELWLLFDKSNCFGDSLSPLKMNVLELENPMSETITYYSNYDPKAKGLIRKNGLKKSLMFTMSNLTYTDSIRGLTDYVDIARISLSDTYTDKNGVIYNNYGTYLLRNYYEHPEYFKNSYSFIHNLCPGFYFELSDGLGLMAKFSGIQLRTYYRFQKDTVAAISYLGSASTTEVLQTTKVTNNKEALAQLAKDESCTYLKSPSGIVTEVTLPVDDITKSHASDSLLSVSIAFNRENSGIQGTPYLLKAPSTIIMLPTDSLKSFFEEEKEYDYKSAFVSTLDKNSYSFSNIGNLVTLMAKNKADGLAKDPDWVSKHPNWNKVLLVPISVTTSTTSSTSTVAIVSNEMGLVTTKLVGGPNNPIDIKVIYARFKNE